MEKKKKITLGMIIIFIILLFVLMIYFYSTKNKVYTIQATVSYVGGNYLFVQDEQGKKYSLVNHDVYDDDVYNIGDKVIFEIKNMKKTDPIQGTICSIEKVNQDIGFTIQDEENTSKDYSSVIDDTNENIHLSKEEKKTEEDVVLYLEQLKQEVESSHNFTSSLKSSFIELVDFLFYGGTIQGKTFSSLSNQAKIKVLKIAFMIDTKIEGKFPNYKESIQEVSSFVYDTFREKVIVSYLDLAAKVCQENEESCTTAKEGLGELKKSGLLTWQFVKDISSTGVSKLKSWYEVWRDTSD